ncbi:MAG: LeuA family protein [Acidobacteriota bacterium]|nr:LeuA family protein [Acidobacteriota bacterium]
MSTPEEEHLVFDWAEAGPDRFRRPVQVMLDDETLRDGLQSPSVIDPPIETKLRILHLMNRLGIETADVGLPGAGPRQYDAVERLCREIDERRLRIRPNCAGRTVTADIQPMAEITQKTGVPIEACVFIGSSPIRQYAEGWDLDHILSHTRKAIEFAVGEGLEVMYVTEDTIRSAPAQLEVLLTAAVEAGARRVCLCDTVGAAIPPGVRNLVSWVAGLLEKLGTPEVGIDWHGHRDRGMGLANSLAAIEAGATRVHGTALGIGERVGNTAMEQLLVNLKLLGIRNDDLSVLHEYVELVADAVGVPIPVNTAIVGRDAFRTATGVHAAAVIKAQKKGDAWLADRIYSGVPAGWIGRKQEIEIGHMSGKSNVLHYLTARALPCNPDIVAAVLDAAKRKASILTEAEVREIVEQIREQGLGS